MKISCQSCHSKYNVADDKVQGKIVKIRCRKCGSTIVVNGSASSTTNGSAPAPAPRAPAMGTDAPLGDLPAGAGAAAGAGEWHVSVTDSDQRTMSLAELVAAYHAGEVAQDAFIWAEGMDDWKPLGEVDAVVSALYAFGPPGGSEGVGGRPDAAPAAVAVAAAPAYEPMAAQPAFDRFERPAPAPAAEALAAHPAAVVAEPKRAAVVKREARARDLFATRSGEELQTSASSIPGTVPAVGGGDDERLTGQRNENSVLFSLDHLSRNAGPAPTPQPARTASKDDSGLIDLQALVAKAESMRPQAMPQAHLLAPPLGFAAPLGAPMGGLGAGIEGQPKSKLPLLIGAGAGVIVLMVVCIMIGLRLGGSPAPAVAATASASASPIPSAATADSAASATATASASASASAAPVASVAPKPRPVGGGGAWKPNAAAGAGAGPKPAGGGAATGAGAGGGGGAAPATGGGAKKGDCGCNGDLMCMMKCSTH
jgi:predicted Zn finger-like uncharacterized protein